MSMQLVTEVCVVLSGMMVMRVGKSQYVVLEVIEANVGLSPRSRQVASLALCCCR